MFGFENIGDLWQWVKIEYPLVSWIFVVIFFSWVINKFLRPITREHQAFWKISDAEEWNSPKNRERREIILVKILMDIREMLAYFFFVAGTVITGFIFWWIFK